MKGTAMPCTTWPVDARRRRLLRSAAASAAVFWGGVAPLARAQRAAPGRALTVALVPYLSARAMLTQFEPMRVHLAATLGRPVEFFTASSFAALLESVRTGQQPFTLLPMHLARIAVADWGHVLVARSTLQSPVEVIAPRSLRLEGAASLRGRRLAVFDPWSLTTLMLRRWLQAQRLNGAVQLVGVPSISASAAALARGEVDAMVAAHGQSVDVPWLKPDELSVVAAIGQVHSPCFVAQRGLAAAEVAAFRAALLGFVAPAGRAGASGAPYVEGSPHDLEPYEPYAAEVRRMLTEGPRPSRK
jgi:ABC-type phosphate/phosphonate transport system substrate-binding protein